MTLPAVDIAHTGWMPLVGFALGKAVHWGIVHAPEWCGLAEAIASDGATDAGTDSADAATDRAHTPPATHLTWPCVAVCHAALWWACAVHWDDPATALAWAVFSGGLLMLAWIDWRTTFLPDALTQPLLWCGLMASGLGVIDTSLHDAVFGAVVGYGSLWAVALAFEKLTGRVGMGGGDLKLVAALGAWLGPGSLLPVLLMASSVGAGVGWVLQKRQRLRHGLYLPFGPFLAAAGWGMALVGEPVLQVLWSA
jgi:leader peptidase (prepilin peptidase)/N-methyltransferase